VLHLPQEGTHRYRLPRQKEQEERKNEETPAGKVRHESAARGKLQDEVSSPTTTQEKPRQKKYETRYLKRHRGQSLGARTLATG
jgi:hypothetical protein